jgi:hypothetical protein
MSKCRSHVFSFEVVAGWGWWAWEAVLVMQALL